MVRCVVGVASVGEEQDRRLLPFPIVPNRGLFRAICTKSSVFLPPPGKDVCVDRRLRALRSEREKERE